MGRKFRLSEMRHARQPIGIAEDGIVRFKQNAIVRWLVDTHHGGQSAMNTIAVKVARGEFRTADYVHLMQLIGYSAIGYCDLSQVPRKAKSRARKEAARIWELSVADAADSEYSESTNKDK